jgi:hypothetical protein
MNIVVSYGRVVVEIFSLYKYSLHFPISINKSLPLTRHERAFETPFREEKF